MKIKSCVDILFNISILSIAKIRPPTPPRIFCPCIWAFLLCSYSSLLCFIPRQLTLPQPAMKGDRIGFYFPSQSVVPFTGSEGCSFATRGLYVRAPSIAIGRTYTFGRMLTGWNPCRKYSFRAYATSITLTLIVLKVLYSINPFKIYLSLKYSNINDCRRVLGCRFISLQGFPCYLP